MKKFLILFLSTIITYSSFAQQDNLSSAEIYAGLQRLNVLGRVLYIAAHPDDENTRLLTYLSKEKLYRTGYLSLTRGDGGQNLIGDEQGILLGLIRTQELLAARRTDGTEQFFSRAFDFGFSKNPEETFTKWDKEKVLADVVWTIRKFRPDVIITRFPTTGEGGHGHHTASAILANEAFKAAADPKKFPEQLAYVKPWQASRILWNTFNFGGNNTQKEDQFKVEVGGYNAVLGKSYGEIAADSRSQHKSQGFGVARSRGEATEYFATTGGKAPQTSLMDGINTTWKAVSGSKEVEAAIQNALNSFDFLQPGKSVPALVNIYKALQKLPDEYWRNQKIKEVTSLIEAASGLWAEASTNEQNAVQGDSIRIFFNLNNRSGSKMVLNKISVQGFDSSLQQPLLENKNLSFSKFLLVPNNKPVSQPYWLEHKMEGAMYTVTDQQLIGQPDITPPFVVQYNVTVEGLDINFFKTVYYKHTDPVKGEITQPVFVVPALSVVAAPDVLLFQKGKKEMKEVTVDLIANKELSLPSVAVQIGTSGYHLEKKDSNLSLSEGNSRQYAFTLNSDSLTQDNVVLPSSASFNKGKEVTIQQLASTQIQYDHIPTIRYFYNDGVKVLNLDIKTVGKTIGYIVGAGDKVPEALTQLGYNVVLLGDRDLFRNNLQQYDAIITGIRAYNTNDWMNHHYQKLMQYVEEGGNLIVQYNTSSNIGPVKAKIGPYDFNISRNRITDENAAVTFLEPDHAVFNFPNKINKEDFSNWIQERSIYHATGWDQHFTPLVQMADPGEAPENGSLVVAKYGKGYFTYTGIVFFRQLPAGVPGAYRLLANLIALNAKKTF